MPKIRILIPLLLGLFSQPLLADLASIHKDSLPQTPAVLQAFNDAAQLEPFSKSWSQNWSYPLPKAEVIQRLRKDLDTLTAELKANPTNEDLLLLTGTVARYAYNVDVESGYQTALDRFGQAEKLAPSDVRPEWFRADLFCQTKGTREGMQQLLAIENSHPWRQLPPAFWDDYMECATVNNMPAHALRAADHLQKLQAPPSDMRTFLIGASHKRIDPFDPQKNYSPRDVWYGVKDGDNVVFTSNTCGLQFTVPGDWQIDRLDLTNGSCIADFSTPAYKAVDKELHPSVMVLVQQPKSRETLEEYAKRFTKDGTFEPFTPSHCPSDHCIALKGVQPGMYNENGDGHGRIILFEREEPDYPGLLFETPAGFPPATASPETQYFRPSQTQGRIPGKLYYLVLVDTAASIEGPAMKDYDFFLQHLKVE